MSNTLLVIIRKNTDTDLKYRHRPSASRSFEQFKLFFNVISVVDWTLWCTWQDGVVWESGCFFAADMV